MAKCGSCGADTPRIKTHFEGRDGRPLKSPVDSCPQCHPEEFVDTPFIMPSDMRFHMAWETNPEQYDTLCYDDGERVPCIKDWAKGEFEQLIVDAPEATREEEEAKNKKRAFARERNSHGPMTPEQIKKVQDFYQAKFDEDEKINRAVDAGLILVN